MTDFICLIITDRKMISTYFHLKKNVFQMPLIKYINKILKLLDIILVSENKLVNSELLT